jgi:hypothetical protein
MAKITNPYKIRTDFPCVPIEYVVIFYFIFKPFNLA